jgi:hypothetical protein
MEAWRQGAQEVHQQRNHPEKNPIGEREREREREAGEAGEAARWRRA